MRKLNILPSNQISVMIIVDYRLTSKMSILDTKPDFIMTTTLFHPRHTVEYIKQKAAEFRPKIGLILGSGLSHFGDHIDRAITLPYTELPGFSHSSVAGHKGSMLLGTIKNTPIVCLQGRSHYYEGKTHTDIQTPIRVLKLLGCETLILTNAAASLRNEVPPGSLVLIEDHINFQFNNPLVGPNDDGFGPRFPCLQNAYDKKLLAKTTQLATELNINTTKGVYLATLGPSYETPAEIRAFKILGADVVGMSTVPEVVIARHCDLKVLVISTITNMAAGMSDEILTHEGVLKVANQAASNLSKLLIRVIEELGQSSESLC